MVDTNTLMIANNVGESPQASIECVDACIDLLNRIVEEATYVLVIDDSWHIMGEYERGLGKGADGLGKAFYIWAAKRIFTEQCDCVSITQLAEFEFAEFPHTDAALATFDKSDRKFVAVARKHEAKPPISVAIDRGWHKHHVALAQHEVRIEFVCTDINQLGQQTAKRRGKENA